MCGICGIVSVDNRPVDQAEVSAMAAALSHRGPDDQGFYQGQGVCLGHRRLSIIDLSAAGHQPMTNEDNSLWVVLNGEIYNYRQLRDELKSKGHIFKSNSDTEVLVHLYEQDGVDCVRRINGMFAFALWDQRQKSLFLARDRIGKKPLLYSYVGGNFYFSSELASLLKGGFAQKEINPRALDHFFTFGYIPAPASIFKDIQKLEPGHTLFLQEQRLSVNRYWQLDFTRKIKISEAQAIERAGSLLEEAVRARLESDVALGVFLSGGIDSGMVTGLMHKCGVKKIRTFSIGFDESDYNELKYARLISERFATEHHEFMVRPKALEVLALLVERFGEPYADPSAIPTYYVSKLSREFVTVALTGDGGDEVFAGYDRYLAMLWASYADILPCGLKNALADIALSVLPRSADSKDKFYRMRRFIRALKYPAAKRYAMWLGVFDDARKKKLYSDDFYRQSLDWQASNTFAPILGDETGGALLDRLLKLDSSFYLPYDLLVKTDISSMACSLEARAPFLDYRLMEFMASLEPGLKISNGVKKYLLKKIARGLLPAKNILRQKQGFGVPIGDWFRTDLKDLLCDSLLGRDFLGRGIFMPDAVKALVGDHLKHKADNSFVLWTMLMFEMWYGKFKGD